MAYGNRTVLLLGGKPIGSVEIARYVKARGDRLVVADYLPVDQSPAKRLADEAWDVSTADVSLLAEKSRKAGVDAVIAGVHEFNIERGMELASTLGLPFWCTQAQWGAFEDKPAFKRLCREFGIAVAREFDPGDVAHVEFPVAVKPADGSGSRGFTKCFASEAFDAALAKAREFSPTGTALVEELVQGEAVIVHYTVHDGKALFCGMADKHSEQMGPKGAPIMALQVAPSVHQVQYLVEMDAKCRAMVESLGIREAPLWIEAFYRGDEFVFNEAGLRFGGSMTNLMVGQLSGVDQMAVLYAACTGEDCELDEPAPCEGLHYAIFPTHLRAGKVAGAEGLEELSQDPRFVAATVVHGVGDEIADWGSAQQVFAYLHFKAASASQLIDAVRKALEMLSVRDVRGNEMLFSLFDPNDPAGYPAFLSSQI